MSLLIVIVIQAFLAHAVNDIFDEDVDRITDLKGTNRFKVLVEGFATKRDLLTISILAVASVVLMMIYLYKELGFYILIFGAVGLYAPLAYSVKPIKLGWRPFSEWTVVFPTLVTLVVAVNFVATGKLSFLAFYTGTVFALFSVIWFLVSRYMDYEPDKKAGKITSAVKLGTDGFMPYYCAVLLILFFVTSMFSFFISWIYFISAICGLSSFFISCKEFMSISVSTLRAELIFISILNSSGLSALFILF